MGNFFFLHPIGVGDSLPRMHELEPRFDQERFHDLVAVDSFLESVPRKSAIALAFVPQLVKSADELGAVLGVDAILNGHEHRSSIVINLPRDRWGPPMERGG